MRLNLLSLALRNDRPLSVCLTIYLVVRREQLTEKTTQSGFDYRQATWTNLTAFPPGGRRVAIDQTQPGRIYVGGPAIL